MQSKDKMTFLMLLPFFNVVVRYKVNCLLLSLQKGPDLFLHCHYKIWHDLNDILS